MKQRLYFEQKKREKGKVANLKSRCGYRNLRVKVKKKIV